MILREIYSLLSKKFVEVNDGKGEILRLVWGIAQRNRN
jgi:hypothetical protein